MPGISRVDERSKDGTYVAFSENSPTRPSPSGTYVGMDNGDKVYLSFYWAAVLGHRSNWQATPVFQATIAGAPLNSCTALSIATMFSTGVRACTL